ncbi:MAG: hypothetical protein AAFW97_04585 [Pseudomonadota bacterium]
MRGQKNLNPSGIALLLGFSVGGCWQIADFAEPEIKYIECDISQIEYSISAALQEVANDFELDFFSDDQHRTDRTYTAQISNMVGTIFVHGVNSDLHVMRDLNPFVSHEVSDIEHIDRAMEAVIVRLEEIC